MPGERPRPPGGAARASRRELLTASAAATLSLWGRTGQGAPAATAAGRAKSVIMIFNCGAPSHTDLWDLKPEAPDAVRG